MDEGYTKEYRLLHESHFWWRAREDFVQDILRSLAKEQGFGPILDVGCGDGLGFDVWRRYGEPEGVEPDAGALSCLGRSKGLVHQVPFGPAFSPGKRYGLILMLDSLEHMPDCGAVLGRARELLAADGWLLITVPAFLWLWTSHDDLNEHVTRFTKKTLRAELEAAGFQVATLRYFYQWLVPCKLAARAREHLGKRATRPPSLPPRWLNRLAYGLSRLEWSTYGRTFQMCGSSLLALARHG